MLIAVWDTKRMVKANHGQRVAAAQEFVQRWKGRGYEKGETHTYWLDLLTNVFGMEGVTTNVLFEQATVSRGYIAANVHDAKTLIEQISLSVDLKRPQRRPDELVNAI